MSSRVPLWLAGTLAAHRRGRLFRDLLGGRPAEPSPPDRENGLCLVFGTDYQQGTADDQERWLAWVRKPGRTLLLLPPLKVGSCDRPARWSVTGRTDACAAPSKTLPAILAPEVRHQLTGVLQVPDNDDGRWDDRTTHTGFHRKHPHSGIFAVTCLPLWSAALLAHREILGAWLGRLHEQAGTPADDREPEPPEFQPTAEHFAVLLHLAGGSFPSDEEALKGLVASPVFALPADRATRCLAELEQQGFATGGRLTERAMAMLASGPYGAYAEALREVGS
jgi:hypothetical protein